MANKANSRSMTGFLRNLICQRCNIPLMLPHVVILVTLVASLLACDPENNPTTMKGRTITPARLPKIHPMTLPKVPASVREQLSGTPGRTPAPATTRPSSLTQGDPKAHATTSTHDRKTTDPSSRDRADGSHRDRRRDRMRQ